MSEPIDDKAFDEYLSGRSQISQRYRTLADDVRETVPPELDRRILAQARDAVAQVETASVDDLARLRTKRRRLMQWSVPAALAASAVLVISIVIRSGVQHEVRAVSERPTAAPAAAAPPAPPPPVMAKQQSTSATTQDSVVLIAPPQNAVTEFSPLAPPPAAAAKEASRDRRMASTPPREPTPAPMLDSTEQRAVAAARQVTSPVDNPVRYESTVASPGVEREHDDLSKVTVTSANRQSSRAADVGAFSAPAPNAVEKRQHSDEQPEAAYLHGDPERWLEHIRELRKNGKQAEADSDWKEFRARYPDYPVAETDAAAGKPASKPESGP